MPVFMNIKKTEEWNIQKSCSFFSLGYVYYHFDDFNKKKMHSLENFISQQLLKLSKEDKILLELESLRIEFNDEESAY